jgi:hypothetical protein
VKELILINQESAFIFNKIEEFELPNEKKYLLKYFRSSIEQQFLKYFFLFGENFDKFTNYTGVRCQPRWCKILIKRIKELEEIKKKSKKEFDFEKLAEVETGKYPLKR